MSRKLYKHSYKTNWSESRYNESNLHNRRYYRMFQREYFKRQGIEMILFKSIDDQQLQITQQNEKRKKNRSTEHQTIETGAVPIESDSEERETIEIEFI